MKNANNNGNIQPCSLLQHLEMQWCLQKPVVDVMKTPETKGDVTSCQSTETRSVTQMDWNFSQYVAYDVCGCWNVVLCIPAKPWPSALPSWRVGHVQGCDSLVLKKQNTRAESCWVEAFGECVRALQSRSEVFQREASLLIFTVSKLRMLVGKHVLQVLQQITTETSDNTTSQSWQYNYFIFTNTITLSILHFALTTFSIFIGKTFGYWHCIWIFRI